MIHPAINELAASFAEPFGNLGRSATLDRDAVVLSWPAVPLEIIHACGLRAVLARSAAEPTPAADQRLEADIFPPRLHQLIEAALTGRLRHVAGIVLPRTSDPDYKCFLYLREFARRGIGGPYPPVALFDLLQTDGPGVREYNRGRAQLLMQTLGGWSGIRPHPDDLHAAVLLSNSARAAANRLQQLRRHTPRISGTHALPMLGAFWQLPAQRYVELASEIAADLAGTPPRQGPRVFLTGAPVDSSVLHASVEAQLATVVDEVGPYGRDAAGDAIPAGGDVLAALVEHCRISPTTARTSLARMRHRIETALPEVDVVVVHQPADDATFGWDYPWLQGVLAGRAIPHAVVRNTRDASAPAELDMLVAVATHHAAVLHG